ncbi:MAG: VPLPA-CTERM-specific exosortase XrtD [Gammaproteobacteria bacterium]|nr:MAG: VPLPA-CTERM-specific exosortase XrtD [Gammaproteobacteria bacterium]
MTTNPAPSPATPAAVPAPPWSRAGLALLVACALALAVIFRDGLWLMVQWWQEPEYQHGYLIPLVSLYLLWARAEQLRATPTAPSAAGLVLVVLGLAGFVLGELSAIYTVIQYAFLLTLWGLVWTAVGWRGVRVLWPGLVYLVFMIPLPRFFQWNLSNLFQLWSSEIGTTFLRAIGISVYLEGNVIDLGVYQLQVVEACSGLRYLFPLVSFSFFCAYIFRGRLWQKAVIFLSAVPITIFMNSFRIAVTGVLVNRYGTGQAEGFLHYFEGWIIFVACIALLFLEMGAFALIEKRRLAEVFEVEIPGLGDFRYLVGERGARAPVYVALGLLVAGMAGSLAIQVREEVVPQGRAALSSFPLVLGTWRGQDGVLGSDVLGELKLTDYLVATYRQQGDPVPLDFYVAYYDSQRKGASVHSPKACLPGGGWQIEEFGTRSLADAGPGGAPLQVNRALITKGDTRALVYYWFMQRGRYLTSEYLVKWFIFWDSLWHNRTDGAMVRVTVPVTGGEDIAAADRRVEAFIRLAEPKLYYFIPQKSLVAGPAGSPAQ